MNHNALSQIKISQLRSLVAVAECGNFGEAALSLGISQSAVSHAIASLEEALGVVLFSRGRRGAQLTPVGEQIVLYARQSLQSLEEMTKAASLARGLAGGTVRIA
ncbi:MAG TPA: LysR family transcriptional regulator, partial [Allocoleopsis sp.]